MYTSARRIFFCTLLFLSSCSAHKEERPSFDSVIKKTSSAVTIPEFTQQKWNLPNGLQVVFAEDHELPLVSAALFIPGGGYYETPEERGQYQALGDLMRLGGAGELSGQQLDRELEKYAASIGTNFGQEFGTFSFSCLSSDVSKVAPLFQKVLLSPRFDRDRLSLWKGQTLEGIKRRVDDPTTVATLSLRHILLAGSPFGTVVNSKDVLAVTRERLRQLHARAIRPEHAVLAISGDISRSDAEALSNDLAKKWKVPAKPAAEIAAFPEQQGRGIYFIEQPLTQATVLIGQLGAPRLTPDQYAIEVFNQYFGSGGFGSLLTKRIRTELGLAYSVYGTMMSGYGKGRNIINLQTKSESSGQALYESIKSLSDTKDADIPNEDLVEAQNGIVNAFVFNFTSAGQVLSRKVQQQLLNYPENYDATYIDAIKSVKASDIRNVVKERWKLEDLVIVVVGPQSAFESLEQVQYRLPAPLNQLPIRKVGFRESLVP